MLQFGLPPIKIWIVVSCVILNCDGYFVQFFKEKNFEGGVEFEANSSSECMAVPGSEEDGRRLEGSAKTSGCIVIYQHHKCNRDLVPDWWIIRLEERDLTIAGFWVGSANYVKGFRSCSELEERPHTDLDIRTDRDFFPDTTWEGIVRTSGVWKTKEIRNICTCSNFKANGRIWEFNGYGNCFNFYKEKNCKGELDHVVNNLGMFYSYGEFKSIGPCTVPKTCTKLKVSIFNFEPLVDLSDFRGSPSDKSISATRTFVNNGTATINQAYKVEHEVTSSVEFEVSSSFSKMLSFSSSSESGFENSSENTTDSGFNIGGSLGIDGGVAKIEGSGGYHRSDTSALVNTAKNVLTSSSQNESESGSGNATRNKNVTSVTYTVESTLIVPPCTQYGVKSLVKVAEGVTVVYRVYFTLKSETIDGVKLTAKEIIENLELMQNHFGAESDIVFLANHTRADNYTAVGVVGARHKLAFGVDAVLEGEGEVLHECLLRHKQSICKSTN